MGSRRAVGFRAATGSSLAAIAFAGATMSLAAATETAAATRARASETITASAAATTSGAAAETTTTTTAAAPPVGNDISFPQCGTSFPSGQSFGIVGLNDGVPGTLNPCLGVSSTYPRYSESELYWAVSMSSGSSALPKASLYVNTSDPGNVFDGTLVSDWPASGSTPYGACTTTKVDTTSGVVSAGQNSPACAWEFGDREGVQDTAWLPALARAIDAQSPPVTVPVSPSAYPWWLDVETTNTWQQQPAGQAMNLAALQGIVVGLRAGGAPSVGVYASEYQWVVITGGTSSSTTTLGGLATWIPGAADEAGAQTVCGGPSFTAGTVSIAQFPSGRYDGDLSCGVRPVTQSNVAQVYGPTPDATAAAEFVRAFPYTKNACPASRAAVLASTKEFQDALSSQFLAGDLATGTLLTPTANLPSVTAATLKEEGITTVYLVGGPLAVTTAVVREIESLTAYDCGGVTRSVGKIAVHRIYGENQYATAMFVAEQVGTAGQRAFPGAYANVNATGTAAATGAGAAGSGSYFGKYNDTDGTGTAAPMDPLAPTAILASGVEFQDAQAASVISYRTSLPLLLTPATALSTTAVTAIQKLGVKQVILLGGTLAISNTVEQALVEKTGVSVLRVAGQDYTDTARELARFEAADATEGLGWTPGHRATVARGNGFTDGLCGAVLDSPHNTATGPASAARPLLLTEEPTVVGSYLTAFLKETGHTGIDGTKSKSITTLTVLGGPLVVSAAEIAAMQTDLSH